MILGELVLYKDGIINLETKPIQVDIKVYYNTLFFDIYLY